MEYECPVCGGLTFERNAVLWPELVEEWELAPHEREYIDDQQGLCCTQCGTNLRAMTLAKAITHTFEFDGLFSEWAATAQIAALEINEAYNLTAVLSKIPGHVLASYPAVDMQALPYQDGRFDLVVHSDTLEHVADPVLALSECRRVLKPGGWLAYTVPVIVERMSRSRKGMPPSYHAGPNALVHTEFGADFWTYPMRAGFRHVELVSIVFPASVAVIARK